MCLCVSEGDGLTEALCLFLVLFCVPYPKIRYL